MKIAIGGTHHAGKTVLMGILRCLLPRELFMVVEAAPDGEGITGWSAEADARLVKEVRNKGKFLPEFVAKVVASIKNSTAAITLVDLGGMQLTATGEFAPVGVRLTKENEAFVRECDYIIVIAPPKYAAAVPVWLAEAERLGVKPLAILESVLEGADDEIFDDSNPLRARITKLDRACPPVGSPTAKCLVERVLQVVASERQVGDGSDGADVNFHLLAQAQVIDLAPSALPDLVAVVRALNSQSTLRLWGNTAAGSPYHALACQGSYRVSYYDPKVEGGYLELPELVPQGQGNELLEWQVGEMDGYTVVRFAIPRQVFDHQNLSAVVPPAVSVSKGVVLSGKTPRWLTGAIARAYGQAGVSWLACFQPQESGRRLDDGRTWAEANPGMAPAVVVAGPADQLGTIIAVPISLIK